MDQEQTEKYQQLDFAFLIGIPSSPEQYAELFDGELLWPVPGYHTINSPFGVRIHPVYHTEKFHYGIDIPALENTPVQVPADGLIKSVFWSDAVGLTMEIDHGTNDEGRRLSTRYCHLEEVEVMAGQTVEAGDTIATVGNTGYLTTGAHLHFETHIDGYPINPEPFFQAH